MLISRIERNSPAQVHVGLDVDRLQALGEPAGLGGAVVLLDVLARAGDGQQVEQREVVEAEHLDQPRRRALGVLQIEPAVELLLRQARGAVDAARCRDRASAVSSPSVTKAIWLRRSARRLLTGVAESISTRVLTPSLMIWRIRRS